VSFPSVARRLSQEIMSLMGLRKVTHSAVAVTRSKWKESMLWEQPQSQVTLTTSCAHHTSTSVTSDKRLTDISWPGDFIYLVLTSKKDVQFSRIVMHSMFSILGVHCRMLIQH
jgi:hypothetical protein